jgi:hypothetical protein
MREAFLHNSAVGLTVRVGEGVNIRRFVYNVMFLKNI